MGLKNLVGDFLGYARCPVTGDTYWRNDAVSVPYADSRGVLVLARALAVVPKEDIARRVMDQAGRHRGNEGGYNLKQIVDQIPKGCFPIPRNVRLKIFMTTDCSELSIGFSIQHPQTNT